MGRAKFARLMRSLVQSLDSSRRHGSAEHMMTETLCKLVIAARTAEDRRVLEAYLWFSLPAGYKDQFGLFSDSVPCFCKVTE